VMRKHGAEVINLGCTIMCAMPRIGPVAADMRENIAAGLNWLADRVSVEGKTNDGGGPEGQGDAISATVLAQVRLDHPGPPELPKAVACWDRGMCSDLETPCWVDRLSAT
jgi:hypothetical protein